jgi:hypothetical protein
LTSTHQPLKNILPASLRQAINPARYALLRAAQWPAATFHPLRRASIRRLADYRNIHQGTRAFIIGNGPSLKNTDLTFLRDEYTFGMNRIYLLFPELGFQTSFYLAINSLVVEQCADDIRRLSMPRFLSWRSHAAYQAGEQDHPENNEDPIYLHTTYTGPKFAQDVRGRLWEGATVTYVALQMAFYMGFEQVILVGVDHSFSAQGKPNATITSQGEDRDHFDGAYFGKGFRWQLPDLDTSEKGYHMARQAYEAAGRQVLDATVGGKLQVFPKIEYASLFS